ncbi:MAG: hypothetical protein Q9208_004883 [Pyrenodesmia sp. 3 TL-2023]
METLNNLLQAPRMPATANIRQLYQVLRNRLQLLVVSILEAQIPLPESSCSCNRPGNCRIVLATVITDDSTPFLEPSFVYCNCGPPSYGHHQRQLELIAFDLQDNEQRVRQLMALDNGLKGLLDLHREFYRIEISMDQYWIQQEYCRTNMARAASNLKVLRKNPNAAKIPWDRIHDRNYQVGEGILPDGLDSQAGGRPKLFQVDKDDLFTSKEYEEIDEYPISALDDLSFGTGSTPAGVTDILQLIGREVSPDTVLGSPPRNYKEPSVSTAEENSSDTVRGLSPDTVKESSPDTIKEEPIESSSSAIIGSPNLATLTAPTPAKIRLGRLITLEEVLSRFEDIKEKAASYMHRWELEDSTRDEKISFVYPQPHQGNCSCTSEHNLYHSLIEAAFNPLQQTHIDSLLQTEIRKSDIRRRLQQETTSNRQVEIDDLLQTFEVHVETQMRDLHSAQYLEGRLKALVAYLKKYDGRDDLPTPQENRVSSAVTMDLLKKVDAMSVRWAGENQEQARRVDEMVEVEAALERLDCERQEQAKEVGEIAKVDVMPGTWRDEDEE